MIRLTQLNGLSIYINYGAIELIEEVPHTIITTVSNSRIIVKETAQQIIEQGLSLGGWPAEQGQGA